MVKIIMHGCCGHMGQVISQIVKEDADAQIVAGIDPFDNGKMEYPVYKSLEDCKEEADVVIDFASAKAEDALLDYCGAHKLPVVVCTTGTFRRTASESGRDSKKDCRPEICKYVTWYQHPAEPVKECCKSTGRSRI